MRRRTAVVAGVGLFSPAMRVAARPASPRVVFLNPGEPVERGKGPHWLMTARLMTAAANAFGMTLEVLYSERNHLLMLRQAESLAQRVDKPDYVVLVNEKLTAPQMLRVLARTPSKVLLIHNDITVEQRREIGNEREQIPNWIGTATTDETRASVRLMEELSRQLQNRSLQVIGITGDRSAPVSMERAQGIANFISRTGRGQMLQLAVGDWSESDAQSKADVLLSRYPQANVIWAGSDSMALGAMRAVRARNARALVAGTGAWPEALKSVIAGGLAATVGSQFFIGAWAMVLLHDYHNGFDFAARGGPRQKLDYMYVVNRENAPRYEHVVYGQRAALDFSVYSKVLHPAAGPYDFDLASLVRAT